MQTVEAVFILDIPKHRCAISKNDTYRIQEEIHAGLVNASIPYEKEDNKLTLSSCLIYVNTSGGNDTEKCDKWVYDTYTFPETAVTMFNMVYDDLILHSHANMAMFAGSLGGAFIMGYVSDRKIYVFIVIRLINAFSSTSLFMTSFVIGLEMVGPSKRVIAGMGIELFWCVGLFVLTLASYVLRHWQTLQLIMGRHKGQTSCNCSAARAPVGIRKKYSITPPRTRRPLFQVNSSTEPTEIRIKDSVIKGYHEYHIRPPMTNPSTRLRVDLEYTNIKDPHASLVWIPDLSTFTNVYHNMVTDDKRCLSLKDIAGLPMGHAPCGLSLTFRQIIESGCSIYSEPTGEPLPSFPPWPPMLENGGSVVVPCDYIVVCPGKYLETKRKLEAALQEMPEGSVMSLI